jgi:hypothetical protein
MNLSKASKEIGRRAIPRKIIMCSSSRVVAFERSSSCLVPMGVIMSLACATNGKLRSEGEARAHRRRGSLAGQDAEAEAVRPCGIMHFLMLLVLIAQ